MEAAETGKGEKAGTRTGAMAVDISRTVVATEGAVNSAICGVCVRVYGGGGSGGGRGGQCVCECV
jgi:hypothetical protein